MPVPGPTLPAVDAAAEPPAAAAAPLAPADDEPGGSHWAHRARGEADAVPDDTADTRDRSFAAPVADSASRPPAAYVVRSTSPTGTSGMLHTFACSDPALFWTVSSSDMSVGHADMDVTSWAWR